GAQRLTLVALADHVEAARLAGLDVDLDVEAHVLEQLLEDDLARGKGLGRGLGGLELGTFRRYRASRGRDLGFLALAQGHAAATLAGRTLAGRTLAPRAAVVVPRAPVVAGLAAPIVTPRAAISIAVAESASFALGRGSLRRGLDLGYLGDRCPGLFARRPVTIAEPSILAPGRALAVTIAEAAVAVSEPGLASAVAGSFGTRLETAPGSLATAIVAARSP